MSYIPAWLRLSAAVDAIMGATGCSREEAQADICQAIADGTVKLRGKLKRHTVRGKTSSQVLEGKDFQIASEIKQADLDWENSRPVNPWAVHYEVLQIPGHWELEWIELLRTDVINVLCAAARPGGPGEHAGSEADAASRGRALESNATGLDPLSSSRRTPGAAGSARRRGARPKKFEQVRGAMRGDLQQGRLTLAELKNMLEKELAADYGVSRDTARKARNAVLAEFDEN
jgi:hypothetical protein